MKANIRNTEIYFDVDGAGLAVDATSMREKPVAFVIHGGPGSDHSGFRKPLAPLAEKLQLVYFDHRGSGRSAPGDKATYTLDENVEDMERAAALMRKKLNKQVSLSLETRRDRRQERLRDL